MKTKRLISSLVSDLKSSSGSGTGVMLLKWLLGIAMVLLTSFIILPFRQDTMSRLGFAFFDGQTILWFMAFIISSFLAYKSVVPGLSKSQESWLGLLFLLIPVLWVLFRLPAEGGLRGFGLEMSFFRGRCGFIIIAMGALQTAILFALARHAAPTQLGLTGAWAAVSSGCLSLFLMQFVCLYDTSLHIILWHFLPLAALVAAGSRLAGRFLRW